MQQEHNYQEYLEKRKQQIDQALEAYLFPEAGVFSNIVEEGMHYAVCAGGKRIRPILVLEGAALAGLSPEAVMPAACSIEFLHTYSLVHDDLPAMDNDVLRRGRPTCHVQFGEAMAILIGDALLTKAFEVLSAGMMEKEIAPRAVLQVMQGLMREKSRKIVRLSSTLMLLMLPAFRLFQTICFTRKATRLRNCLREMFLLNPQNTTKSG